MCGVYPDADVMDAGEEISSTYEGRHVTLLESELVHPDNGDGFVNKGDPVLCGNIVGVAFKSAAAATDLIAIDTEGIWVQDVAAVNDWGNSAVAPGDAIYIDDALATLSKKQDPESNHLFGFALGVVPSSYTKAIAVKVHNRANPDNILMGITTNYTEATSGRPRVRIDSDYSGMTGNHNGLDVRVGAIAAGAASPIIRGIHGYAFTSGVKTNVAPAHYVLGTCGLVGLGGTIDADNLIAAGLFGQVIAGGGTLTKLSHLCAIWGDFGEPTEPGTSIGTEVLYLSNNSTQH